VQYNTHTLQWCRPSSVTAGDYYYYFYYSFPHYARASYTHPGTHADTNTRVRAPAARDRFSSGFSSSFNFFFSFSFLFYLIEYLYFRCFSARPSVCLPPGHVAAGDRLQQTRAPFADCGRRGRLTDHR